MSTIRKRIASVSFVAALLAPGWAGAQWYGGVNVGKTNNEWTPGGASGDKDNSTYAKVFVGHSLTPLIAAEVGFANLGKFVDFSSTPVSVESKAVSLTAVGRFAVSGGTSMFARLGAGGWKTDFDLAGSSGSKSGAGLVVGLGLETSLGDNFRLGFEWEQYQNVGEGAMAGGNRLMGQNVDTWSLRLAYHLRLAPGP